VREAISSSTPLVVIERSKLFPLDGKGLTIAGWSGNLSIELNKLGKIHVTCLLHRGVMGPQIKVDMLMAKLNCGYFLSTRGSDGKSSSRVLIWQDEESTELLEE